jgi:hypothetical protein
MTTTNASILVAGGGLTVLICPLAATLLLERAGPGRTPSPTGTPREDP